MRLKYCYIIPVLTTILTFLFSCSDSSDSENDSNASNIAITGDVTNTGITYAQVEGIANISLIVSAYSSLQIGIQYSETSDFKLSSTVETTNLTGNMIFVRIEGLNANTKYYYRTIVRAGENFFYGKTKSFTTNSLFNFISSCEVSDTTNNTAKFIGNIDIKVLNEDNSFRYGVAYSTDMKNLNSDSSFLHVDCNLKDINENTFELTISGLTPATNYYYCSYIHAGESYLFGEIKNFTTKKASLVTGEWEGDWGMWYEDEDGYIFDADYTYIKLVPDHSNATHGVGYQEDYYSWDTSGRVRSYYRYLWYKFDWEIRNGIIYLYYYDDLNLDSFIRDYSIDNTYFSGYFGDSPNCFRMSKLTDFYYWTPSIYIESGWYGYDVYYDYSKQFEGTAKSKSANKAPVIVKQGRNRSHVKQ